MMAGGCVSFLVCLSPEGAPDPFSEHGYQSMKVPLTQEGSNFCSQKNKVLG